jgi:phosphate starvation-inducible PhoH-like protein
LLEKIISLADISLIDFLGVSNANLQALMNAFPQTKIIARGEQLTIRGSDDQISLVEAIVNQCIAHLESHSSLSIKHMTLFIDGVLNPTGEEKVLPWVDDKDVLLFGNKGIVIKVKTPNQRKLVESASKNDIVFAIGPAGTGKTYTAVALAVKALKNKEVKKIIITRPAVEAGENLGFLPGDLKEKIDPYLRPIYDDYDSYGRDRGPGRSRWRRKDLGESSLQRSQPQLVRTNADRITNKTNHFSFYLFFLFL